MERLDRFLVTDGWNVFWRCDLKPTSHTNFGPLPSDVRRGWGHGGWANAIQI